MADVTVSYKGNDILEMSDSGSATLKTGGTYCEADIELEYVKPSGGSGIDFIDVDEGEITVTSSGLTTLTINHNLGVVPFCCMVIPKANQTGESGKHTVGGVTFFASSGSIPVPTELSIPSRANAATYAKEGYYTDSGYSANSPHDDIPSAPATTNYVKNFTSTSFWLSSSSSYPIMSGITYRWRALAFNSNL